MNNPRIFIIDAQSLTALTIVKAINRRYPCVGFYRVDFVDQPALSSNYWDELIATKNLDQDLLAQLIALGKTSNQKGLAKPLILTATDDGVIFLSQYRDLLNEFFHLPVPELETVNRLMDKSSFYRWAEEHGFPVVKTTLCENNSEFTQEAMQFNLPFIVKPKVRGDLWNDIFPSEKILIIDTEQKRNNLLGKESFPIEAFGGLLLQALIPGGDENVHFVLGAYDKHSRCIANFSGRKLAQWPPNGGSTLVCEKNDNAFLLDLTNSIFSHFEMAGLCSMEYKQNSENDNFYIIEPTVGRCDYQSLIAEYCGVKLVTQVIDTYYGISQAKCKHRRRIWMDEFSLLRQLKMDAKTVIRIINLIGIFNIWRIRFLLFTWVDLKPFIKMLKKLFKLD